jgi:ABC-type transport system involved in Fe-S cluster assembly fused permease/ATPase subunit
MHTGTGNGTSTGIGTQAAYRLHTGAHAFSTQAFRLLAHRLLVHKHTSIHAAHRLHTCTQADELCGADGSGVREVEGS